MSYGKWMVVGVLATWMTTVTSAEVRRYDGPGPVEIHVHAKAKTHHDTSLKDTFRKHFYPAISKQKGFLHCDLLSSPKQQRSYVVTIAFESEDLRVKWANSPLHQEVWPKMQANFEEGSLSIEAFGLVSPK